MRKYITDYAKNCPDCIKYKASNQKPSGLLKTPVPGQRFESLAIDLFRPLLRVKDGKRWILIIEDCTTKWVELFALPNATAKECAITLIEEVLLRYSSPPYQ
ncbi:pro-Pol polyprotein [Trichonephila clavipes]|nr:pro-Pol polyprotein [Trichonephila clavipes]